MTTRVAAFGDGARFLMPSYEYIKGKNGLNALNRDHYTVRFGLAPSGGRLSCTEPRLRRVLALRAPSSSLWRILSRRAPLAVMPETRATLQDTSRETNLVRPLPQAIAE